MASGVVNQIGHKTNYGRAGVASSIPTLAGKTASEGLARDESWKLKEAIGAAIVEAIRVRKLSRREAAAIIGVGQDKVSLVFRRRLRGFSIERLFKFLLNLGHDIEVSSVESLDGSPGHIQFSARRLSPSDAQGTQ